MNSVNVYGGGIDGRETATGVDIYFNGTKIAEITSDGVIKGKRFQQVRSF